MIPEKIKKFVREVGEEANIYSVPSFGTSVYEAYFFPESDEFVTDSDEMKKDKEFFGEPGICNLYTITLNPGPGTWTQVQIRYDKNFEKGVIASLANWDEKTRKLLLEAGKKYGIEEETKETFMAAFYKKEQKKTGLFGKLWKKWNYQAV